MHRVESYTAGAWHRPAVDGRALLDAATGQAVAELSPPAVDLAASVAYGRDVGGPALRELTFHQRAAMLRNVGKLLLSEDIKEQLYDLSYCTGATRADSWIDIEGGAGVLMSYASNARRELPNSTVAVDGAIEPLSRDDSFSAVHVLTARKGVEVQINAFNFPVWGMLEKLAPAFLAGVPSIVKPASVTAYLAEAAVRLIVESGLLPEGALQLVCVSPPALAGLLDCLEGQDSVAFTGSAAAAAALRTHPAFTERAARLNIEADSLNAAVLAPAAVPGTAEFDIFVAEVVKEMTVKAGQKCTAIRRALVPAEHLDAAADALATSLADVAVGDPRDAATGMGPLVGLAQRDEVSASVAALRQAAGTVVDSCDLSGVDADAGAFMAPVLLRAADPRSETVHTTEAFGPVSTLVGYRSLDEAVELVAAGGGSLVASLYGADRDEIAVLATGVASHHGRVLIVDETMASASTGHGPPLPPLVHGGPGRAGGGQEMGGMRGVFAHMQRTAVQGSPDMLTAITGEYIGGAATREHKGHPFKLTFDDLEVGDSITTGSRAVTRADIAAFAESTGDKFYAHMDEEAAARSPIFNGLVAHGYLVLSFAAGLFVWPDEGPVLANYGIDRLRFAKPTYPGDEIHVVLTCKRKRKLDGRGYGEVAWDTRVINQHGEVNAAYDVLTMVANAPGINGAPEARSHG
ncbi:MAG: phenylacetic acid degradation bifunctional protein PaaZ [Acidimicrobiaceae bacterium]|nr:phenylacetic acid degradation bifunctional protein PaaZ [Acidimicrobiaceae bacterium]MDE0665418.1 phenylacetic acid degradation bifunctional protein PaaZ [Acidimicrobiaceae bacterium]MXY09020.1 phenylacetic acid degradation bifunctional protein PaaZ [Acidimicrobiaceae bacterium]MXZ67010.1 phenylacetic acid degradation bifunctional protein PaaZ [Acidimicrobiaceae bacterium]MYF33533.1 phenylacetic acid degradation bifunctional protein PaaZ [Acidimicrobiaceae bacterium]